MDKLFDENELRRHCPNLMVQAMQWYHRFNRDNSSGTRGGEERSPSDARKHGTYWEIKDR